jgi:hypothetical protein
MDLTPFHTWLITEKGLTRRTADVYRCNVKRILTACPEVNKDTIEAYFTIPEEGKPNPANHRSNWKRFVEFAKTKGIDLPSAPLPVHQGRASQIPEEVLAAIEGLRENNITTKLLCFTKWEEIEDRTSYYLVPTGQPGTFCIAPKAHMDVLKNWDWTKETGPLVPYERHSAKPMHVNALRRVLASRRRTLQEG